MHTGVFLTLLSALIAPTIVANRGSVYGVCSKRFQNNQRLIIPTKEAAGHFLQGFCGTLTILVAQTAATTVLGVALLLVYPIYNFFKRLHKSSVLGLNNTSYGNNTFDFLLGVWTSLCFYSIFLAQTGTRKSSKSKHILLSGSTAIGIIVLMSTLLVRGKIQAFEECNDMSS